MLHALYPFVDRASTFAAYQPSADVGDYETLDITQRDKLASYVETFEGTIARRLSENPKVPVLETAITIRLHPYPRYARSVIRAINDGRLPDPNKIESAFIEDGQHRWDKIWQFLSKGLDCRAMVTLVVCDDDEATEVYLNINGKTRKPSPAVTDLFFAKKLRRGQVDTAVFTRQAASLVAWHLTMLQDRRPLPIGLIEVPLSRPPIRHTVKFHRTVGLLSPLVSAENPETFDDTAALVVARRFSAAWESLGLVLRPYILGDEAVWQGLTLKDWALPHVFNIFTAGLIVPQLQCGALSGDVVKDCQLLTPIVERFFEALASHPTLTAGKLGFRGLGGSSSEGPYVDLLRASVAG